MKKHKFKIKNKDDSFRCARCHGYAFDRQHKKLSRKMVIILIEREMRIKTYLLNQRIRRADPDFAKNEVYEAEIRMARHHADLLLHGTEEC